MPAAAVPVVKDPLAVEHPEAFAGRYKGASGEVWTVAGSGHALALTTPLGTSALRPLGGDIFSAADDSVLISGGRRGTPSAFAVIFEREPEKAGSPGAVTGVSYGSRWYAVESHSGSATNAKFEMAERYIGVYTNDSPWLDQVKVVERNGKLWLDGAAEMRPAKNDSFSVEGGEGTLQLSFASFLQGRAQLLQMGGDAFRRVALAPGD